MPDAIVERDGHVMTITMNRPEKRNSLIHPLRGAILQSLREADADTDATAHECLLGGAHGFVEQL